MTLPSQGSSSRTGQVAQQCRRGVVFHQDAAAPLRSLSPKGTRAVVHLVDERRYDVPVLLVCPEFTTAQAKAWRSNLHGFLLQRPASIDMAPR